MIYFKIILLSLFLINLIILLKRGTADYNFYCGLFGFVPKDDKQKANLNKLKILGIYNIERGKDSCGFYFNDIMKKGIGLNANFTNYLQNNIIENDIHKNQLFIGHTRKSTMGANSYENAHPFENEKMVLAHNGMVRNYTDIKNVHQLKGDITVDSQIFLKYISQKNNFDILKEYEGFAALSFMFKDDPSSLYLYKGASRCDSLKPLVCFVERPLYILKTNEGIYYSSLEDSLKAIKSNEKEELINLESNVLFKIKNNKFEKVKSFKEREKMENVPVYKYNNVYGNNNSKALFDFYLNKNVINVGHNIARNFNVEHLFNNVVDFSKISALKYINHKNPLSFYNLNISCAYRYNSSANVVEFKNIFFIGGRYYFSKSYTNKNFHVNALTIHNENLPETLELMHGAYLAGSDNSVTEVDCDKWGPFSTKNLNYEKSILKNELVCFYNGVLLDAGSLENFRNKKVERKLNKMNKSSEEYLKLLSKYVKIPITRTLDDAINTNNFNFYLDGESLVRKTNLIFNQPFTNLYFYIQKGTLKNSVYTSFTYFEDNCLVRNKNNNPFKTPISKIEPNQYGKIKKEYVDLIDKFNDFSFQNVTLKSDFKYSSSYHFLNEISFAFLEKDVDPKQEVNNISNKTKQVKIFPLNPNYKKEKINLDLKIKNENSYVTLLEHQSKFLEYDSYVDSLFEFNVKYNNEWFTGSFYRFKAELNDYVLEEENDLINKDANYYISCADVSKKDMDVIIASAYLKAISHVLKLKNPMYDEKAISNKVFRIIELNKNCYLKTLLEEYDIYNWKEIQNIFYKYILDELLKFIEIEDTINV